MIDRDWLDGRGAPLVSEVPQIISRRSRRPRTDRPCQVAHHAAARRHLDPLVIDFPEPLDYALLHRLLSVESVPGKIDIAREETEWRFTPLHPWKSGAYRIVIPTTLEDLAGNHVGRPFDVDTFDTITKTVKSPTVTLPFQIR